MSACPYHSMRDSSFWRRTVSRHAPDVDPVTGVRFKIDSNDKVVTAGSCFAQHIARYLRTNGFNYYTPETISDLVGSEISCLHGYDVFSARYGNIYTARQLLQLFDRVYGEFSPSEEDWEHDGRWFDPFRPHVERGGFRTSEELKVDRAAHFSAVRNCFEQADIFVFTLGLTEAWVSSKDGAVFPLCPGCGAGRFDPGKYEFVNFSVSEVVSDIEGFLHRMRSVNDSVKVILTVSPIPLVATAEDHHVVTSTTYSKSVLRVSAQEIFERYEYVDYFPSYEMITANYAAGTAFAEDWREVKEDSVARVMSVFLEHYCDLTLDFSQENKESPHNGERERVRSERIAESICDESRLDSEP